MHSLLTVIVTWLSINFSLPALYEHPHVKMVSAAKMAAVRYSRLGAMQPDRLAAEAGRLASADAGQDVYGMYDDVSRTIYLHEGWTGATPAEASVLVHELVHHLQNVGGLKYDCPQAREKPAYRAQMKWLELFGTSLEEEFQIDAMTILVRASCM